MELKRGNLPPFRPHSLPELEHDPPRPKASRSVTNILILDVDVGAHGGPVEQNESFGSVTLQLLFFCSFFILLLNQTRSSQSLWAFGTL